MVSDISLAVGDGSRRMTYAELAQARAISPASPSGSLAAITGIGKSAMTGLSEPRHIPASGGPDDDQDGRWRTGNAASR